MSPAARARQLPQLAAQDNPSGRLESVPDERDEHVVGVFVGSLDEWRAALSDLSPEGVLRGGAATRDSLLECPNRWTLRGRLSLKKSQRPAQDTKHPKQPHRHGAPSVIQWWAIIADLRASGVTSCRALEIVDTTDSRISIRSPNNCRQ